MSHWVGLHSVRLGQMQPLLSDESVQWNGNPIPVKPMDSTSERHFHAEESHNMESKANELAKSWMLSVSQWSCMKCQAVQLD